MKLFWMHCNVGYDSIAPEREIYFPIIQFVVIRLTKRNYGATTHNCNALSHSPKLLQFTHKKYLWILLLTSIPLRVLAIPIIQIWDISKKKLNWLICVFCVLYFVLFFNNRIKSKIILLQPLFKYFKNIYFNLRTQLFSYME